MSVTLSWQADNTPNTPAITQFNVLLSTDLGATFTLLASVPFNTARSNSNYNQQTRQFSYLDSTGNPGNIYQIISVGSNGNSAPVFAIAPPILYSKCAIIGFLVDPFGDADPTQPVKVSSFGSRGERWTKNQPGIVAQQPFALGIIETSKTVYPDATGLWSVELLQSTYAKIEIPCLNYVSVFEVPAVSGPINVRDIPTLRGEESGLFPNQVGDRPAWPES
jgi:hypothetical protein